MTAAKRGFELRRIFVLVSRGTMDKSLVCVCPWEVPILAEIHGDNAVEVSIDELCSMKGAINITKTKLRHSTEEAPDLRGQYELMATSFESNPLEQPEMEYQRLLQLYGMHNEVNLPNVEKVWGSQQRFRAMLVDFVRHGGSIPGTGETTGSVLDEAARPDEDRPIADMSINELRAHAKELGIAVPKGANRAKIEELVMDHDAATVEG